VGPAQPVNVPDSLASLYSVELSNKELMILGLVVVNLVIALALCCLCVRSRMGKYRKYEPVVAAYLETDTEV